MGQQQQFDLSSAAKDQDFLHAPTQDKIAFLAAHDPDFAKASKADQAAYLNHILGNDEPTQFEKANTPKPYYGFTPGNLADQAYRGGKELAGSLYEAGKDVLFPQGNTEGERLSYLGHKYLMDPYLAEREKARNASTASESIGHSVAQALPLIGPWAASLGEQAGSGDVGGSLARGGAQYLAGAYGPKVAKFAASKVLPSASEVGLALRTEKGAVKPVVGRTAGLAGAGLGYATGIPGGELLGYGLGEGLAGSLIPERPFDIPVATNPGGSLPLASDFYENMAKDLTARGRAEEILQRRAARSVPPTPPFAGATSSASPSFNAPLPEPSTPMPQPKVAGINATPTEVEAGIKGSIAKPSGRLVLSPEEARAESAMQDIATRRAKRHGMLYAAGMRPAGGGRVPMTPTPTETFEYPQRSAYEPPEAPYSRGGGAEGPYAPPDYVYRAHDVGNYDTDPASHAHATESEAEAQTYAQSRNAGTPQQVSKINLGKVGSGGFEVYEGPNGKKWYRFKRPLTSEDYEQ